MNLTGSRYHDGSAQGKLLPSKLSDLCSAVKADIFPQQ